ncbi:ribosomal protein S16 [Trametes cingulata]|nr:ribosomal protein S16 [Trametes cingulata]
MAVRLRMAVHGVRNNRIFHLVAVNQRQRRNAKPIELLGVYNPRLKPGETTKTVEWSVQRIKYWLKVGATPSKTVTKLLQMGGVLRPDHSLTPDAPRQSKSETPAPSSEDGTPPPQATAS